MEEVNVKNLLIQVLIKLKNHFLEHVLKFHLNLILMYMVLLGEMELLLNLLLLEMKIMVMILFYLI